MTVLGMYQLMNGINFYNYKSPPPEKKVITQVKDISFCPNIASMSPESNNF